MPSCPAPCSSCAPRPRLPLRTVPTRPSADRSEPAAFLALQSFDVGPEAQSQSNVTLWRGGSSSGPGAPQQANKGPAGKSGVP